MSDIRQTWQLKGGKKTVSQINSLITPKALL